MGISCNIGEYIGCIENKWTENNNLNQEINHIFMVNGINKETEIKSKEEHLEIYWIKIDDMEKENILPYSMREIIKNIHNKTYEIKYISEL